MRRLLSFVMIEVGNTVVAKMLPPTLLGGFPTWVLILIAVVLWHTSLGARSSKLAQSDLASPSQ